MEVNSPCLVVAAFRFSLFLPDHPGLAMAGVENGSDFMPGPDSVQ